MLDPKTNNIPNSIDILSPFLTKLPRIRHMISPDRYDDYSFLHCGPFPWYERHCDMFTIEFRSNEQLSEVIGTEMTVLRQDCKSLVHGTLAGQDRPWEDIWTVILRTEEYDTTAAMGHGPVTKSFVFLVYWSTPEAMARVKDPKQENTSKHVDQIRSDWWDSEILARLEKLKDVGASVEHGNFHFRDLSFQANTPLLWPDAEILAARQASGEVGGGRRSVIKRKRYGNCCHM